MPKKIIRDVVMKSSSETVPPTVHDSFSQNEEADERVVEKREAARIDASPLFERMKEKQRDRESFAREFSPQATSTLTGGSKWRIVALVLVVIFLALLAYGFFAEGAEVALSPKKAPLVLDKVPVTLENKTTSDTGETVGSAGTFSVMTLALEDSRSLTPTGEEFVEKKATGKITIYNSYSAEPQRLVKNTRFQSPDGKIYRIPDSVVVPGMKKEGGKDVPGSLETVIYADLPGDEYNTGIVDFTIPGFKGLPQYSKFSAKGKTSITGGFQGKMKVVAPADLTKAKSELENSLKKSLWEKALADKPAGTAVWQSVSGYEFEHETKDGSGGSVSAIARGTLFVGVFDEIAVSRGIAQHSLSLAEGEVVLAENLPELHVEFKDMAGLKIPDLATSEILVSGNTLIVWQVDTDKLAESLAGIKKQEYSNVFAKFPGIERARVTLSPFWKTRFPKDPSDIEIQVATEEGGEEAAAQ